jgi:AcrR family transcriptional regulator
MSAKAIHPQSARPDGAPRRPGRPRGPSQAERLRQSLITEASELYAQAGYAGISFATLAERTDLTKATVFHYFPKKEALVYAVFEALGARLEAATLGLFDPPPASFAARLERVVNSLVDFYGADPLNARILCQGFLEGDRLTATGAASTQTPRIFARFVRRFAEFVQAGMEAGEFQPGRPMATVMNIGGIILFEFMLPDRGRFLIGEVALSERRAEMAAVVARAVVRPRVRMRGQAK